jgi:hypothetical protein
MPHRQRRGYGLIVEAQRVAGLAQQGPWSVDSAGLRSAAGPFPSLICRYVVLEMFAIAALCCRMVHGANSAGVEAGAAGLLLYAEVTWVT